MGVFRKATHFARSVARGRLFLYCIDELADANHYQIGGF